MAKIKVLYISLSLYVREVLSVCLLLILLPLYLSSFKFMLGLYLTK